MNYKRISNVILGSRESGENSRRGSMTFDPTGLDGFLQSLEDQD